MATSKTATKRTAGRKPAASKPAGFAWPKPAKQVLADYLKAEVTDAQDAPNRAKPFINEAGVVHLHSSDWREWLKAQGLEPTKGELAKPLRDAGLKVRAFPLRGEGRSLGFYIPAPNGTARLPRRVAERTSRPRNPFRSLSVGQRGELLEALTGPRARSETSSSPCSTHSRPLRRARLATASPACLFRGRARGCRFPSRPGRRNGCWWSRVAWTPRR
jgi:hypothetical protein